MNRHKISGYAQKTVQSIALLIMALSCTTPRYIHDEASLIQHKKLLKQRQGNVAMNAVITTGSVILSAITGGSNVYTPSGRELKKITFQNVSPDTLFVNLLTDFITRDNIYCDIMDIRIPPEKKCRLLLPNGIRYNVYFSNTPEPEDDEMIEVQTAGKRRIILYPGMTVPGDTTGQISPAGNLSKTVNNF
ncbi:MAG: hypothetical protein ACOZDD_06940 [Bacteroidota bacterium]